MSEPIVLTADACDRATAYHMSNKIVRRKDGLYVTWLDAAYRNQLTSVDPATGKAEPPLALSQGFDNHCGATLAATEDGWLNFLGGSHSGGLLYRSSAEPMDPRSWSLPETPGACATYPSMIPDAKGGLCLVHRYAPRDKASHWGVAKYLRTPEGPWRVAHLLAQAPAPLYSYPTNSLALGPDGTIHLVVEWYKTYPETVHPPHSVAVSHLTSPDGEAWFHTDGREVRHFPVRLEDTSPILFKGGGNPRPGNVAVLPDGRPVLAVWDSNAHTLALAVRHGEGDWRLTDLGPAMEKCRPGVPPSGQAQVSATPSGEAVLVLQCSASGAWGAPDCGLQVLRLDPDSGKILHAEAVAKANPDEPDWLPSIEKAPAAQCAEDPWMIYLTGRRGEGCVNEARCEVRLMRLG